MFDMVASELQRASSAARDLLSSLAVQRGTVNVVAVAEGNDDVVLKVWFRAGFQPRNVPSHFAGFPVKLERQPSFSAGD